MSAPIFYTVRDCAGSGALLQNSQGGTSEAQAHHMGQMLGRRGRLSHPTFGAQSSANDLDKSADETGRHIIVDGECRSPIGLAQATNSTARHVETLPHG